MPPALLTKEKMGIIIASHCLVLFLITTVIVVCMGSFNKVGENGGGYCATTFTKKDFQGLRLDHGNESRWNFRRNLNFVPGSVKIYPREECSLTIFDGKGNIQTFKEDAAEITWPDKRPIHLSCCQCGQCEAMKNHESIECARIYQHEKCSACIGSYLDLRNNEELTDFKTIHDRIASLAVRDGCQVEALYEIKTLHWKVMIKTFLRNGDNLFESQDLFNEEASVQVNRAVCVCSHHHHKHQQHLRSKGAEKTPLVVEDIVVRKIHQASDPLDSEDDFASLSKETLDDKGPEQSYEDMFMIY